MAVVARFVAADKFSPMERSVKFQAKPWIRFDPNNEVQKRSTDLYRNYIDLVRVADLTPFVRRSIIASISARLSDPKQVAKESAVHLLIYLLRRQALALAFFGGAEFSAIAGADFSKHPGYDAPRTEQEEAILVGFYAAIVQFRATADLAARSSFTTADISFGKLRHVKWLLETQ